MTQHRDEFEEFLRRALHAAALTSPPPILSCNKAGEPIAERSGETDDPLNLMRVMPP